MASYTAEQLKGAGTPTEALVGNKTFTFTKPTNISVSAYFTMETVRDANGFYSGSIASNAIGAYTNFTNISASTLVTSSFIASVVIPEGGGAFQFNPTVNVALSGSMLRATGGVSLVIS